jgi:hypothetical protein
MDISEVRRIEQLSTTIVDCCPNHVRDGEIVAGVVSDRPGTWRALDDVAFGAVLLTCFLVLLGLIATQFVS